MRGCVAMLDNLLPNIMFIESGFECSRMSATSDSSSEATPSSMTAVTQPNLAIIPLSLFYLREGGKFRKNKKFRPFNRLVKLRESPLFQSYLCILSDSINPIPNSTSSSGKRNQFSVKVSALS